MSLPIGVTIDDLVKHVSELIKKWEDHKLRQREDWVARGRKNSQLIEITRRLYPQRSSQLVELAGSFFPAIVVNAGENQFDSPDSVLGPLDITKPGEIDYKLYKMGEPYLNFLIDTGRRVSNKPDSFAFERLSVLPDGGFKIDCSLASFRDTLLTSGIMEWELLTQLGASKQERIEDLDSFIQKKLLVRNYVHSLVRGNDPILNPTGRKAVMGIHTLILFNRGDGYAVLLGERSQEGVAIYENLVTVVPAGMFEPLTADMRSEFSAVHNMYREYLEELFSLGEVETPRAVISHRFFYNNRNLKFLKKLIENNEAKLSITGITFNLLDLRPDLCLLLWIGSTKWYEQHSAGEDNVDPIKFNAELKIDSEKVTRIPNTLLEKDIEKVGFNHTNLVPPSAAAISLGLNYAKKFGYFS
jgi:hypothetical protein